MGSAVRILQLVAHGEPGLGEVDVICTGKDDVEAFPAIYSNLFNEQTFDNSGSTWVYNVIEDLPDFFD